MLAKFKRFLLKLKPFKRAFKVDLITCFIGLITFTVFIVVYNTKINSKSTLTLAKELVNSTAKHAVNETTHYLTLAHDIPFFSATLLSGDEFNLLNNKNLENHLIQTLQNRSELFMYYIADEKGNFMMSYRNKYQAISTQLINREAKKPFAKLKFRDKQNQIYAEHYQFNDLYDPRTRPWYIYPKQNLKPYWTEIYNFYADDLEDIDSEKNAQEALFGFTISNPLFNTKHQLIGVIAVDITLNQLADFLAQLKIGINGKSFIINKQKQLILLPTSNTQSFLKTEKKSGIQLEDIKITWLKIGLQNFFKSHQAEFFYQYNEHDYFIKIYDLSAKTGKDWYLVIAVPVDDFLIDIKKAKTVSFSITAVMLFLSVIFSLLLSKSLSRPLEKMTATMLQINDLDFTKTRQHTSPIREFQQMADALTSMTQGLKAFLKYVPPELVRQLIKRGETISLGGKELELSLFFSDIEDFTEIAETIPPIELMADLSRYFDQMVKVIALSTHGTVDKYIGDSVMAFWGAPNAIPHHARLACLAALNCQYEIAQINLERIAHGKRAFNTRIGIHTGIAIVGNIGSSDRYNYTVIGDNVNLASRIEGLNKIYKTNIIVSESTYLQVQDFFALRPLDFIVVKGRNEGIKIYELLAELKSCDAATLRLIDLSFQAFENYLAKRFAEALRVYLQILDNNPDDQATRVMIAKCEFFIEFPPDEAWTGATRLTEK